MAKGVASSFYFQAFLILLTCALDGADLSLLGATLKALEESLGLTPMQLGLMSLAQALSMSLAAPVWGWLCDTGFASRRELMSAGALGWGLMMVCTGLAKNLATLVSLRLLNGAFTASLTPLSQSWVGKHVEPEARGRTFGFLAMACSFGAVCCTTATVAIASRHYQLGGHDFEGWRLMSFLVGILSMMLSLVIRSFMHEEEPSRMGLNDKSLCDMVSEVTQNLQAHWRLASFRTIISQGVVGSIPWNAMNFEIMFLFYVGFTPQEVSRLTAMLAPTHLLGPMIGGYIGDWAARVSPYHGRAFTAQFSVMTGIPLSILTFIVLPNTVGPKLNWFLAVKAAFNLTATWCLTGVNRPLLNDIVDARSRASIVAWDVSLEGAVAAIFGMPLLGFLAEHCFGYHASSVAVASMPESLRQTNMYALQKSLFVLCVVPWIICFAYYTRLHWTYEEDMETIKARHPEESSVLVSSKKLALKA